MINSARDIEPGDIILIKSPEGSSLLSCCIFILRLPNVARLVFLEDLNTAYLTNYDIMQLGFYAKPEIEIRLNWPHDELKPDEEEIITGKHSLPGFFYRFPLKPGYKILKIGKFPFWSNFSSNTSYDSKNFRHLRDSRETFIEKGFKYYQLSSVRKSP